MSEISSGTKRLPVQNRSQRLSLFNFPQQPSTYMRFKWSANLYKFLCLCFGLGSSLCQITKIPSCSFETNKHSNNSLSGRYVTDAAGLRGNYDSEGYTDFSLAKFGFVIHLKKSILHPMKQLEFLGLQINTEEKTLPLSDEKLTHIIQQCQDVYAQPRTSVLSLTKFIGLLLPTFQAILPGKIQFRFLQQTQTPGKNFFS